ncbi:GGDEF domain-containing protein [Streptomyces sp. NP160]|nr:GGDEF domain-containing protein [Streptomyces sp. NP160]
MAAAFTGSRALLMVIGRDARVLVANPAVTRTTGWTSDELAARPFWETFVAPEDRARARADFSRAMATGLHFTVEGDWVDRCGGRRRVSMQVDVLLDADGRPCAESLVGVDVTDQRHEQAALRRRAETDALTGLANRTSALARLQEALSEGGPGAGVLFCDLDGFKAVNDRDGHHAGDLLLVEVARRLSAVVAPGELAGRYGGDEFIVISPGADHRRLDALAAAVRSAVERPVALLDPSAPAGPGDPRAVRVGVSTGTATGHPGDAPDEVVRSADRRMYQAKTARRSCRG